ncbi:MAG TPA: ion transporter [Bryobacteraceae bacterium]|nr:ion transporter [Bryobacteraceae bacterium]
MANTAPDERHEILQFVESWLELPMVILGIAWLVLLIVDLTLGLSPFLENAGLAIWAVFLVDFLLRLWLAPKKWTYIKSNWLTAIALAVPALRVIRALRAIKALQAARAVRGVRFLRVVGSLNRGMRTLHRTMSRRGFGYVLLLTLMITLVGAAGMYGFERPPDGRLADYGTALWWTAMIMTTMGSDYWPQTPEGRLLCLLLGPLRLRYLRLRHSNHSELLHCSRYRGGPSRRSDRGPAGRDSRPPPRVAGYERTAASGVGRPHPGLNCSCGCLIVRPSA